MSHPALKHKLTGLVSSASAFIFRRVWYRALASDCYHYPSVQASALPAIVALLAATFVGWSGKRNARCEVSEAQAETLAEQRVVLDAISKSLWLPIEAWIQRNGVDATVNRSGQSALSVAAESGAVHVVQSLLSAAADPEGCDTQGFTSLMYAARNGHTRVAQLLIENSAALDDHTDIYGNAPLHGAVGFGHIEAARVLLLARSDPNLHQADLRAPEAWGAQTLHETPMHVACRPKPPQIEVQCRGLVLLLLSFGASPCAQDDRGDTPVHILARKGDAATLWSLLTRAPPGLAHGAAHILPNQRGATAVEEAVTAGVYVRFALYCGPQIAWIRNVLGLSMGIGSELSSLNRNVEDAAWETYRGRLEGGSSLLPFAEGGDGIRKRVE